MRDIGSHARPLKVMGGPKALGSRRSGRVGDPPEGVGKPRRCPASPAASLLPARWPDGSPARSLWVIINAPWYKRSCSNTGRDRRPQPQAKIHSLQGWLFISLREKPVKIGARVINHGSNEPSTSCGVRISLGKSTDDRSQPSGRSDYLVGAGPGGPSGDRPNHVDHKRPAGVAGPISMGHYQRSLV